MNDMPSVSRGRMLSCVVRIMRRASDQMFVVGAGCLCADGLIITCAHVVAYALGLSATPSAIPADPIWLDFPFAPADRVRTARVSVWLPAGESGAGDIAILELQGVPPAFVGVAPLGVHSARTRVSALGFPSESTQGPLGEWATGVVREARMDGWVQIEGEDRGGYWVKPGFSGTPVWDDGTSAVVGLVAAAETDPAQRVAFMIPMGLLVQAVRQAKPQDAALAAIARRFDRDRLAEVQQFASERLKGATTIIPLAGAIGCLADVLEPGETLVNLITAVKAMVGPVPGLHGMAGLLCVTDRRVLYVYKVPMLPPLTREFPFASLKRVRSDPGSFWASGGLRVEGRLQSELFVELEPIERVSEILSYVNEHVDMYVKAAATQQIAVPHGNVIATVQAGMRIQAVAAQPNGDRVAAGIVGAVLMWESASSTVMSKRKLDLWKTARCLAFSPDLHWLAVGSEAGAELFDLSSGEQPPLRGALGRDLRTIAFSPDGRLLAGASNDKKVYVWELETCQILNELQHDTNVATILFTPDGCNVLTACGDGTVRAWDVTKSECARQVHMSTSFTSAAFTEDGSRLVVGRKKKASIFDTQTGGQIGDELLHEGTVTAVAFSPDGRLIATGSSDRTGHIWDTVSGQEILRVDHNDEVTSIAFTWDCRHVVTGSNDRTVKITSLAMAAGARGQDLAA